MVWYFIVAAVIGVVELISVMLIRDGEPLWMKLIYGLLAVLVAPLIIVITMLPDSARVAIRSWLLRKVGSHG